MSKLLRGEQIYDYELRKLLDSYKFVLDEKSLISQQIMEVKGIDIL